MLAIAAVLTYALAYTCELGLSLATYYGKPPVRPMKRALFLVCDRGAALPGSRASRAASSTRRPSSSSTSGSRSTSARSNLSITKAVVYLMIGTVLTILLGLVLMRWRLSSGQGIGRRQTIGEQIYEIAQVQVAEQGLPTKAIGRWFPYVATIMLFIWVVNMLGFIPLPLTGETLARRPDLGHLRRDLVALGDARARAAHLRLHALRGHPLERPGQATSRAGSPRRRSRCSP